MKPILFNTEMVRAILDGGKTQTRRIVKPQPKKMVVPLSSNFLVRAGIFYGCKAKPAYRPGDILYVRETWTSENGAFYYRADFASDFLDPCETLSGGYPEDCAYHPGCEGCARGPQRIRWRPSIHMPREAARIFLRVTGVRVERLQDSFNAPITPILAVQAEGIDIGDTCRECLETYICPCCVEALDDDGTTLGECGMLDEIRGEFSDLWDSTIKKRDLPRLGWACNPWVWVIEFERYEEEAE